MKNEKNIYISEKQQYIFFVYLFFLGIFFKKTKNSIFLHNNVIFFLKKNVTIMKKNTILHFFLNTKKKIEQKYILLL
jgi:hypothetical protein